MGHLPIKTRFEHSLYSTSKMATSQRYKKSNKNDRNKKFGKIKKHLLEYVLKNIPAKFGDDPSIVRQRKLGMMNLTYRQTFFFHWLILGPIGLERTQKFF